MNTLSLSIKDLLEDRNHGLDLTVLAGRCGLVNRVETPRIQKTGLALAGYTAQLHPKRVQILGTTELSYLQQLPAVEAERNVRALCAFPLPCFIITTGHEPPECLSRAAEQAAVPLLRTAHGSSTCIALVTRYLEEKLLPVIHVHGVLVDVLGVGVLILGKSGIGKSECALDLIIRGHRLVADDVVRICRRTPATLVGSATESLQFRMEIRGLGIINVKDLYGVSAIRGRKVINLVIELVEWDPTHDYDRLGLDTAYHTILDVGLPYLKIPLRYGRNLTSIIEVAARNFLLKEMGFNSTQEFQDSLLARLEEKARIEDVE